MRTFALVLLAFSLPAGAQRSASSALAVQVAPEARVDPPLATLQLGSGGQIVVVSAKVRALPGSAIHLQAQVLSLLGPNGSAAPALLVWTGAATANTGGGNRASCVDGSFVAGVTQDLAKGWTQSGSLQCTLTFSLAPDAPAGNYTATMQFAVN